MRRRNFLASAATAAFGIAIVPGQVMGKKFGYTAPSDKLNIAGIGVGGMGRRNLSNMKSENIVALCDVDWRYADKTFRDYPNAKRFKDWRVMFDEMGKSIDAMMVATPDHTHAGVTAHAITLGKHCYTQKPLTHSVYESRLLTKLAKHYKVATQMGNQGNSFDWCRRITEWIEAGVIGDVYEVHCWTDRPIWPQGLAEPKGGASVPPTLDWDLWIGPAKKRPYDPAYTPWNWRGFWDFGTGALGDMACHIMDPLYWALDLKYPSGVSASSTLSNLYSPPQAQVVRYIFPARPARGKVNMSEVKVYWYDEACCPTALKNLKTEK
jgi:predicted dehydrogenase